MGLINEDKLDDYVFKSASERMDLSVEYMSGWNDAIHHIKANAPTVDAEPVRHGKWIDEGQYADFLPHHAWRCSECGEHVIEIDTPWYRYCPSCGSKMDAQEKDDDRKID